MELSATDSCLAASLKPVFPARMFSTVRILSTVSILLFLDIIIPPSRFHISMSYLGVAYQSAYLPRSAVFFLFWFLYYPYLYSPIMPRLSSFSSVASSRVSSPEIRSPFMTITRSERPITSGSSDDIRITPSPCLAKSQII